MIRFLKSVGLDPNSFDLDFDFVTRDENRVVVMKICKDSPWDNERLEEFLNAINNIEYSFSMSFSYRNRPTIYDALDLFDAWYKRTYFIPSTLDVEQINDEICFNSKEEDKENNQVVVD